MKSARRLRPVLAAGGLILLGAAAPSPLAFGQGVMRTVKTPSDLKKFNVTVRRFDPAKGFASGTEFVLPVDSPGEEHAISAAISNVLPVAFACIAVASR